MMLVKPEVLTGSHSVPWRLKFTLN